jgi:hypothetical protein
MRKRRRKRGRIMKRRRERRRRRTLTAFFSSQCLTFHGGCLEGPTILLAVEHRVLYFAFPSRGQLFVLHWVVHESLCSWAISGFLSLAVGTEHSSPS